MENNYCDGSGPHSANPEVRVLPIIPGQSNSIICNSCFIREMAWREGRNKHTNGRPVIPPLYDIPKWEDLKVYSAE